MPVRAVSGALNRRLFTQGWAVTTSPTGCEKGSTARKTTEAASCSTGSTRPGVARHGHGFLAMMSLLLMPGAAAAEARTSPPSADGSWFFQMLLVLAAFMLGFWAARRRYKPRLANLERSVAEAVSIQEQAIASMNLQQQRTYECQEANRELRGAMELQSEELDLTRDRLRAAHERLALYEGGTISGLPLTQQEIAERRLAMESEARSALTDAKAILNRALRELTEHAHLCPIRDEVFIAPRGRVWHLRPDCRVLVNQATDERVYQWCTTCAAMVITPNIVHPNTQRTLAEDIDMFLTHHGNVLYEARTRNELFLLPWMHGWYGPLARNNAASEPCPRGTRLS